MRYCGSFSEEIFEAKPEENPPVWQSGGRMFQTEEICISLEIYEDYKNDCTKGLT